MKHERPDLSDRGGFVPEGPLECALATEARSGRLSCQEIRHIAEAQGVPVAEAGRAVQRLRIKVTGCQLGCF